MCLFLIGMSQTQRLEFLFNHIESFNFQTIIESYTFKFTYSKDGEIDIYRFVLTFGEKKSWAVRNSDSLS